ncbi:hypothetical protein HU200_037365 [Digitaria exilis]|uniref:Legume lectin domain-containing protein n=1 Tax=Digitaria exilis TaxID=1010633 RepID=A0A835BER2_9POAL|nr:hypothetical protein HU200_037365 [Digitaria exilis]
MHCNADLLIHRTALLAILEMPSPLLSLLLLLLLGAPSAASSSFSLDFFPAAGAGAVAQLALSGGANATGAAVSLASPGARVQYRTPIVFPSAGAAFSTYFAFALPASPSSLAFFLTPSAAAPRSDPALAVVFSATHVRVHLAGRVAIQAHYSHARGTLHAWIDYNATSAALHVRLSAATTHPTPPLLSCPLDLSPILRRGPVLAGFRTPSGNCTLFSWAFHGAPYRMHSQPLNPAGLLAMPPPQPPGRRYSPWGAAVALFFAAACGAMVTFFVLFLWYSVATRRPVAPVEHPSDVVYEKIVLVGVKDEDEHPPPGAATK